MTKLKVLDLFSGIGGFTKGLQRTGHFETSAFCEIEEPCQKVLKKNWPDVPIYTDITKLTAKTLNDAGIYPDVLTGGFPCQDISIGSKSAEGLDGQRSGLWFEYKRLIDAVGPRFAIVENVFTLQSRGLDRILWDLAEIGYDATWTMFDSQYFDYPQRRRRIYILAARDGIPAGVEVFDADKRTGLDAPEGFSDFEQSRIRAIATGAGEQEGIAYFTRQRSDEYANNGVASTITKRDYKQFTDLVVHPDGTVRRIMPHERLRVHGFPDTHFDGTGLTKSQQFEWNGMSTQVIEHIGGKVYEKLVHV
jgi:DNA-cytosine methyltransferase